jgi:hypothetical protein
MYLSSGLGVPLDKAVNMQTWPSGGQMYDRVAFGKMIGDMIRLAPQQFDAFVQQYQWINMPMSVFIAQEFAPTWKAYQQYVQKRDAAFRAAKDAEMKARAQSQAPADPNAITPWINQVDSNEITDPAVRKMLGLPVLKR